MTDPLVLIRELRPDDATVDGFCPPADRAALLDDILATPRRTRRPLLIGIAGVAAASAAVLTIALVQPDRAPVAGSPTALPPARLAAVTLALHHLAGVAAARPADTGTGRYWHLRIREQQTGPEGQADSVTTLESWTDATGRIWRHDVLTVQGSPPEENYYEFSRGDDHVSYPSPEYLATLPTEPSALYDFLDDHVSGSSSHEEAIFVAVGDMLRGGFAPPELRSAAIQVLTRLPHVSLSGTTTDALGRTVQQFDFADESIRPGEVQSISFDPQNAQILDEGMSSRGGASIVVDGPSGRRVLSSDMDFTSSVVQADTVDEIPEDVLDKAVLQHD